MDITRGTSLILPRTNLQNKMDITRGLGLLILIIPRKKVENKIDIITMNKL